MHDDMLIKDILSYFNSLLSIVGQAEILIVSVIAQKVGSSFPLDAEKILHVNLYYLIKLYS
jgi:hypothetical protein